MSYLTYLQTAWGDTIEHPVNIIDVKNAIAQFQEVDNEHGAFWVGIVRNSEYILEASKDRSVIAVIDDEEFRVALATWEEITTLYELFLAMRFEEMKMLMERL